MTNYTNFDYGFTKAPDLKIDSNDIDIANRLIQAYRLANREQQSLNHSDDVWSQFVQAHYGDMIELINHEEPEQLIEYLTSLPRQGAGHGYFQGRPTFEHMMEKPSIQYERALWLLDHLVGLAESIGIIRVRCPEQGDWNSPPMESVDALCTLIEQEMSLPIVLPSLFDGFFALLTASGSIHLRSMMATYAIRQVAHFMKQFEDAAPEDIRVAVIGAGIGYTAFIAHNLGIKIYTIYDLPEVNVAQGFFLLKTLGANNVSLFGESNNASIHIQPPSAFTSLPQEFDATVNFDSLPEIAPQIVDDYLNGVSQRSRYFFSINQEAPRTEMAKPYRRSVFESASRHSRLHRIMRHPNWIRAGYVEELYRVM